MTVRRTPVTYALILINVLAFVWELQTHTGFDSTRSLIDHGALYAPLVTQDHQWWRIITGAFLHDGYLHIGLNMFALYQLGIYTEILMGSWRTFVVYAISLVCSGYAVITFSPDATTVGASGAIFGLFGALLAIGLRMGPRGRGLIGQMVPILVLNLVFTFAVPFISKSGHIGGLVAGFLVALIIYVVPRMPQPAIVTDKTTGAVTEAELLEPERPHA